MKTVVLCAGHDYRYKGAYNSDYRIHENTFVKQFIIDLYNLHFRGDIFSPEIRMLLLYIDDNYNITHKNDSLKIKSRFVNRMPEMSLFIEMHLNSFGNTNATGSEILYNNEANRGFCELFAFNFNIYFPWARWRGIKHRTNLYLLNTIKKSVILEPFFLSNNKDVKSFVGNSNNYNMLLMMTAKTINDWASGFRINYEKLLNYRKKCLI